MRYRTLGATGIRVSEIGFGAWGIGGNANGAVAYGPTDDQASSRALRRAFESGINFFDTADFYGFGHSEAVLGNALREVRGDVVIATKAGMLSAAGEQDFSPEYLLRSLEKSLARLGTDYVDLFQLHSPPIDLLLRDARLVAMLERLRGEGRIRAYGISARSPEDALIAVRDLGFRCVQVNFNLLDQRAMELGLFELCQREGAGVIGRTPLCFGFLTGQYPAAARFDADDHRSRWSPAQRERWASGLGLFLAEVKSGTEQTPAQFALRFCLSFAALSTVIPGMLTEEHVLENAMASEFGALPDAERAAIVEVYRGNRFFVER
jgi:aryl-alcohol dehydrogenase-like predicted oxidoreductase